MKINTLAYPCHPKRSVQILNGVWDFKFLGDTIDLNHIQTNTIQFDDRCAVPSVFDCHPSYIGKRGTAAYRCFVQSAAKENAWLRFHGLGLWAQVFVDGQALATCALPYSGFGVEVPAANVNQGNQGSKKNQRELIVIIDNRFDKDRMPLQHQFYDFFAYGGFYRGVEWHTVPAQSLDRVYVDTLDTLQGKVRLKIKLRGSVANFISCRVSFDNFKEINYENIPVNGNLAVIDTLIPKAKTWSPEQPHLHTVHVSLENDDIIERFGMRTIKAGKEEILLNEKPIKLLGYCRHEAHPQFGPALPLEQLIQDLAYLRDLGCNFIRGSHYPQDQRFLDLCDEMGFLVWEESLGWGNGKEMCVEANFRRDQELQTRLMVKNSYNHPSVIIWGFLNEAESSSNETRPLFEQLANALREEDSTRLVSYATMHPFHDKHLDLVDVVGINQYPGWYAKDNEELRPLGEIRSHLVSAVDTVRKLGAANKPVIISEVGAGAIYGWHDPLCAHWTEEYQADYLEEVCKEILENPKINGVAIWQFMDCRTYASSRALVRPRAFNNKGTMDEYRRPKAAYQRVKKMFRKKGQEA